MKKRVLIHDIARHLDVSIATVSLVLNGKAKESRISAALTQRVLSYVEEVGYKPNQLAKSLRTGKTHTVGLVVEDITNPFFAAVAGLIERKIQAKGYRILYCSTNNDPAKTRDQLALFEEQHVDGYILALPAGVETEIQDLVRRGKPLVLFDRSLPGVQAHTVTVDGAAGTYAATQHLLAQGFRRVALVTLDTSQEHMVARRQGYARALSEQDLPQRVLEIDYAQSATVIKAALRSFFQEASGADAVLFTTNYLGVHGLEVLRDLNRRIPQEMAVVCFDDNDLFRLYSPPITVIEQPLEDLTESVIRTLLADLIHSGQPALPTQVQLTPHLLVRASSQGPPRPEPVKKSGAGRRGRLPE
ncbi:LacI family DNA-binding transcriptional regulator [Hymenobacter tenuis]